MNLSKTQVAIWLFICLCVSFEYCLDKPSGLINAYMISSRGLPVRDLPFTYFILFSGAVILLTTLLVLYHLFLERNRIAQEKEEQQRYFSNLIHEVLKGEAQAMLVDAMANQKFHERLCEFVKTCELGQTFVDCDNNDLYDLMKGMEFIYSNRLHSEISEQYFYCEIDPAIKGLKLSYRQKYELIFLLRECLNNIRKYSRYKHTGLKIFPEKSAHSQRSKRAVILEIMDDGIGLQNTLGIPEPQIEINARNLSHFQERYLSARRCTGIVEIFRKAARMDGCLTLQTIQDQGTSIQLRFFPNSG